MPVDHIPSEPPFSVTPELFQGQAPQFSAPIPTHIWSQDLFVAQGDVLTFFESQPQSLDWQQYYSPNGAAGLVHVPFPRQDVTDASSHDQGAQLNESSSPLRPECPNCGENFNRRQERDRHLRSYLPHFTYCPFSRCPWRGDRHDNFKTHWEKAHENGGMVPAQQQTQIYNPKGLVMLILCGALTIEGAASIALSVVAIRAHELGKRDVWGDGWGRRTRSGQ